MRARISMAARLAACLLAAGPCLCQRLGAAEEAVGDIRRDATVAAVQKALPSVVNIATEEVVRNSPDKVLFFGDPVESIANSLGSGVIIDAEGYVLTNFHVVENAQRIMVRLSDKREFDAELLVKNSLSDVALLKIITKKPERFVPVRLAADDDLLLGETVLALGNPFGLGGTVTKGILSSTNRRPPKEDEPLNIADWLQTDAAINPGNSGGALINLKGELIGLNVAMLQNSQNIGFAIPVKMVVHSLEHFFTPEEMRSVFFGALIDYRKLSVKEIEPGSPAEKAGIQPGDVLLSVNGKKTSSLLVASREIALAGANRTVPIEVSRGGRARQLSVNLAVFKSPREKIEERTGLTVTELSAEELGTALGGNVKQGGLWIRSVSPRSAAARQGLAKGMVIVALDGSPAEKLRDVAQRLQKKPAGDSARVTVLFLEVGRFQRFLRKQDVDLPLR